MGLLDGLLGGSMEDPRTQATLQLAQGLLGGGGSMQRLAGGMQGYGGVMAQARQLEEQRKAEALKRQLLEAQIGETKAQAQQRQAEALRAQQQAAEQQRIQSLLAGAVKPVSPGDAIAVSGVRGPRPEALPAIGQQAPIDFRALIAAGVPIDRVKALAESQDYGRPEVARTMKGMVNGREREQQFDKFGRPVGQGMEQYRAPIQADTGGQVNFLDPYNLSSIAKMGKTQTPDGKASNAVAWANLAETKDNNRRVDAREGLKAKTGAATEDERKSAGYAVRMEDALRTLSAVDKTSPSATNPGIGTSLTNMLPEGVANYIRPEDRQRVEAAQLDALDAALTLATGAAYTKEQLKGLSRAYFAQPGDGEKTKSEKAERLRTVVETARVRAGRAEGTINPILGRTGPNAPRTGPVLDTKSLYESADSIINGGR